MNLISCDNCGAVYDANKISFPKLEDFDFSLCKVSIDDVAEWDGERYVAKVSCRVCQHSILKPDFH